MIGHHLLAYASTLAAVAGYQQVNAVADAQFSRQNNEYQIPQDLKVLGAYAGGAANVRTRIMTASLALRSNPQVLPISGAILPGTDTNFWDASEFPVNIKKQENLRVEMESNSATIPVVGVWVAAPNWNKNIQYRDCRWVRGTCAVTTLASAWALGAAIALDETLEGGSYAVYGMQTFFATNVLSRLVFQNQYYRPGCTGLATAVLRPPLIFNGGLGLWGVFDTYSLPQLEVLDTAAAAVTYTVWLLIAKADGFQPPFRNQ